MTMTATITPPAKAYPTTWGLDPVQLHDHFWAARGVHVVRQGDASPIEEDAEQYLLTDPRTLVVFRLRGMVELISWVRPQVLFVRLRNGRGRNYREIALTGPEGEFLRFERDYEGFDSRLARVAFTRDPELARLWQEAPDVRSAWGLLRRSTRRARRETLSLVGRAYDRSVEEEVAQFVRDLVQFWKHPRSTISNIRKIAPDVWAHEDVRVDPSVRFVGPAWIGAGRSIEGGTSVLGPAALWDDPATRPQTDAVSWQEIEPVESFNRPIRPRQHSSLHQGAKRLFDIAFAVFALLVTAPIYPLVMLAIWLEDGRPFFFGHRRESIGGREFPCIKFRSMRKNADQIKAQLIAKNQADGPQFFMDDDPRLTRVGRVIRKLNIDELPQFVNVLLGDMSVVGPRPSPHAENQFCPPWREARLSVKPGITGLWQVSRTRRRGLDFQEWIKYDIQYVENAGWRLDLYIIWKTILLLLKGH